MAEPLLKKLNRKHKAFCQAYVETYNVAKQNVTLIMLKVEGINS